MRTLAWSCALLGLAILLAACSSGDYSYGDYNAPNTGGGVSGGGGSPQPANWTSSEQAFLTAGMEQPSRAATDSFNGQNFLYARGIQRVDEGYEFTTPVGDSFEFSVSAREDGNFGAVQVAVAHAEQNGVKLTGGAESIYEAGMVVEGPGLAYNTDWWHAFGDGTTRITVRGEISQEQVLLFKCITSAGTHVIGVRLSIGPRSDIFLQDMPGISNPWVKSRDTIYSNDEPGFGLPAIAVSGDRYSVTSYEVDAYGSRMRRWLQYDAQTSIVTGGESASVAPDAGSWRDQEITALNNVLAIAYTGDNQVRAEISLDRGASFGIEQVLNESTTTPTGGQRLVQLEVAPDYTIAIAYWRTVQSTPWQTQLCVVEATPTGFDTNQTPTGYSFAAPWVVYSDPQPLTPILMDIEYSSAGDLVVAYGFNQWSSWSFTSNFRCCVRLVGGTPNDQLVDSETESFFHDPSVSLIGSGSTMQVFYAYEMTDGLHVRHSRDAGMNFTGHFSMSRPGAFVPQVHAREINGTNVVDLVYLSPAGYGWSLEHTRIDNFLSGTGQISTSTLFECSTSVGGTPSPSGSPGLIVSSVGWVGFDSVMENDDIAVVLHSEKRDLYAGVGLPMPLPPAQSGTYYGSGTVTLLPGMTGSVPAPSQSDANQLEIIVID